MSDSFWFRVVCGRSGADGCFALVFRRFEQVSTHMQPVGMGVDMRGLEIKSDGH